jgi:hypothetical protein
MAWDVATDGRCAELAGRAADGDVSAWRELVVLTSGEIERWASRHPTLRRWGMNGADDTRAVLVRVLERMAANRYQALADYRSRRLPQAPAGGMDRLARLDELEEEPEATTPFAAWLRVVVRYALLDHLHHRLGWGDGAGRRAVGSGAARWSQVSEPGTRPPITDWISVQQRMVAVDLALDQLPAEMAAAVRAWADGATFEEIAGAGSLEDSDAARRLVRAGHARLRGALRGVSEED